MWPYLPQPLLFLCFWKSKIIIFISSAACSCAAFVQVCLSNSAALLHLRYSDVLLLQSTMHAMQLPSAKTLPADLKYFLVILMHVTTALKMLPKTVNSSTAPV